MKINRKIYTVKKEIMSKIGANVWDLRSLMEILSREVQEEMNKFKLGMNTFKCSVLESVKRLLDDVK